MRRSHLGWLSLCTLLVACQATVGGPNVAGRAKKPVPTAASAKPTTPSAGPSAAAAVPTTALAGLVKMDASYVISAGGGNVISAGGANVVSAGGGNMIKVGGQVISAGGANVVSAGGGNYRTLATQVAFGEMLPVSGLAVVAVSLRTGQPLGEAVLTDGEGRYKLTIPKSETGNVRIVAAVAGKDATDPRLQNARLQSEALVSGAKAEGEQVLDDDRALVSRYFRQAFVGRMAELLDIDKKDDSAPPDENAFFQAVWNQLIDEVIAAGSGSWPKERQMALAERMADNLIYHVDFSSAKVSLDKGDWPDAKSETSFAAISDVMRRCRLAAIQRMSPPNEAYFDTQPFVIDYQTAHPESAPVLIRKPSDLGSFITKAYMTVSNGLENFKDALDSLGIERKQANRLAAAEEGLMTAIGITMVTNKSALDAVIQLIRDEAKKPE